MEVAAARRHARVPWINLRSVLGLILFCTSLIAGQRILQGAETMVPVWTSTRDLPQDHVVGPGDLEPVDVRLPASILMRYVPSDHALEGATLTRAIGQGELIATEWVAIDGVGGPSRSMTIPVEAQHAVGGQLRPGDRIDVFATFQPGDIRATTTLLLRGAEVVDVVTAGGLALGEEALVGVTVAVSPEDAARVAFAVRTADIDLVRVIGAIGTGGTQSVGVEDFE